MPERKIEPKDTAARKPNSKSKQKATERETKGFRMGQARSTRETKKF